MRKVGYLLIALLVAAVLTWTLAGAAGRTHAYFAMERQLRRHRQIGLGRSPIEGLGHMLEPFAPVWEQVEPKVRMQLDPADLISRVILETGTWEKPSWRVIEESLQAGGTFVDIGAHIGYYSLKAAAVVGPEGRVIAVEPNPETVAKLRANLHASGDDWASVEPVACSDAEGQLELFGGPSSNTGETSISKTNAERDPTARKSFTVRARPLDSILADNQVTRVDWIKIDVEGAEMLVLKGSAATLDRYHPRLLVEVEDSQLRELGTSAAEVVGFLLQHGYREGRHEGMNVEFVPESAVQ